MFKKSNNNIMNKSHFENSYVGFNTLKYLNKAALHAALSKISSSLKPVIFSLKYYLDVFQNMAPR